MTSSSTLTEAGDAAKCALHPEVAAEGGTCLRCGSFMCLECRSAYDRSSLCVTCYQREFGSPIVAHVRVFAVVLAVHGVLLLLAGGFALVYGASLAVSFGSMPEPSAEDPSFTRTFEGLLVGTMALMAFLHVGVGALQLLAGLRLWKYQGRGLGIAAAVIGVITVVGCYCAPTSMGILIWGLIVLLNAAVAERFASARRSETTI